MNSALTPLAILETCLYVDDLEAAACFYLEVLDLELVSRQSGRHVFFRCRDRMLLLFDPGASERADADVPTHGARGPGHLAFAAPPSELNRWRQRLEEHGVAIEQIVEWPHGGRSIYFRDPSQNSLEITVAGIWGLEE